MSAHDPTCPWYHTQFSDGTPITEASLSARIAEREAYLYKVWYWIERAGPCRGPHQGPQHCEPCTLQHHSIATESAIYTLRSRLDTLRAGRLIGH